jgi:Tol biopolymer transport system component
MSALLPELNWLTEFGNYTDYRPAVASSGEVVIFERTPKPDGTGPTKLYTITNFSTKNAVPFIHYSAGRLEPRAIARQTRPDICWRTGNILFNGASTDAGARPWVFLVGANGNNPAMVSNTDNSVYPTWALDGRRFVTENSGPQATPVPCNSIFDQVRTRFPGEYVIVKSNIDGTDEAGEAVFGGMPTVGPKDLPQIAFAGQPAVPDWGGPGSSGYDQDKNYIFLNQQTGAVFASKPMESHAPLDHFDSKYQGRAPAWSPNGATIAFESNRSGRYAIYLCDLATGEITQVTDPCLGGQHAKFLPGGKKLVLAIRYPAHNRDPDGKLGPRSIAWVDISKLLKS